MLFKNSNFYMKMGLNHFEILYCIFQVYLTIKIGKQQVGKVIIELRSDVVPMTCTNFLELCSHEKGWVLLY